MDVQTERGLGGYGVADSTGDHSSPETPFLSAKEEECATEIEAAVNQAWDFKNNLMTTTIVSAAHLLKGGWQSGK